MFVNNITLTDFRNYERGYAEFSEGINVIYGENARGKTNVLEAIYFMSTARSHRFSKENELIRFGCRGAKINMEFNSYGKNKTGEISIFTNAKKQIKINKVPVVKTSMLMNYLSTVMFCPEDLKIVKGSPGERRRLLDIGICRLKNKYFHSLCEYYKVLEQRNILLKTNPKSDMMWVWDEKLSETGSLVIWYRKNYIEKLNDVAYMIQKDISSEALSLSYENNLIADDVNEIKMNFDKEIIRNKDRELKSGVTLTGPHRDDFKIFINKTDARSFSSQGQQRTSALSIKMAEVYIIKEVLKESPVLLLDDVLSELDESRQDYILNKINNMQVIITCTDIDKFKKSNAEKIYVESIKKEKNFNL